MNSIIKNSFYVLLLFALSLAIVTTFLIVLDFNKNNTTDKEVTVAVIDNQIREHIVKAVLDDENFPILQAEINSLSILKSYFIDKGTEPTYIELKANQSQVKELYEIAGDFISTQEINEHDINQKQFPITTNLLKELLNKDEITNAELGKHLSKSLNDANRIIN